MDRRHRSRRELLAATVAAFSAGIAGCSGGEAGDSPTDSATPSPRPTATATEAPPRDPVTAVHQGTGDDIATVDIGLLGPTGFVLEHGGSSNFAVEVYDEDGEQVALLANEIGAWAGANLASLALEEHTLDITADGDWRIKTTQFPPYDADDIATDWPVELDGETDTYLGPVDFSDARTLSVAASGDSNNIVTIRDTIGGIAELAVNKIGAYEGSGVVSISSDVGWIDVEMSGAFELVLEE